MQAEQRTKKHIGAIVLAAGSSRRYGADKRRYLLPTGEFLLERTIRNIANNLDEVLNKILVVLRADDTEFAEALTSRIDNPNIVYFCAPNSSQGMGSSLADSISQISNWEAALVCLGDMPLLQSQTLQALLSAYTEHPLNAAPIIIPTHQTRRGHPVVFDAAYFTELSHLSGDQGAKSILQAHKSEVVELAVEDASILKDYDTAEELETLLRDSTRPV